MRLTTAAAVIAFAASIISPPTASADEPDYGTPEYADRIFTNLLEADGLLFNFPLEKMQGQRYCEFIIRENTWSSMAGLYQLMDLGGYSFDVANNISQAAGMAYCPCANQYNITGGSNLSNLSSCGLFELDYARERNIPLPGT